jgi:Domain of unknown function (DUF6285)
VTHDRPSPAELAEAVREFLELEVLPAVDDRRLRFRTLVAINALGILERELDGPAETAELDLADLARRLRGGEVPDGTFELLKQHVAAKLAVASPGYLERYA